MTAARVQGDGRGQLLQDKTPAHVLGRQDPEGTEEKGTELEDKGSDHTVGPTIEPDTEAEVVLPKGLRSIPVCLLQGASPHCHQHRAFSKSLVPTWLWPQAEHPKLGPHPCLPA